MKERYADRFKRLYNQHFTVVYRVALRVLGSQKLAKEMAEQVFTTVWLKRETILEVKDFEGQLRSILKDLLHEHFKKKADDEPRVIKLKAS